jgi:regulator of CtrA degradation
VNNGRASVSFFDRTFDEALNLLVEARNYIATRDRLGATEPRPLIQLVMSCETMRLTARMTQIMAWLLVQKAVLAGEMTAAEAARPEHRLGGREVCTARDSWGDLVLPPQLQDLLDRSFNLYTRIARLDEMVGLRAESEAADQPPLSLPARESQPKSVD